MRICIETERDSGIFEDFGDRYNHEITEDDGIFTVKVELLTANNMLEFCSIESLIQSDEPFNVILEFKNLTMKGLFGMNYFEISIKTGDVNLEMRSL